MKKRPHHNLLKLTKILSGEQAKNGDGINEGKQGDGIADIELDKNIDRDDFSTETKIVS